jgi:undecaprenyl-diphosphatase
MSVSRAEQIFGRVDLFEQGVCERLNRSCQRSWVRSLFRVVSRLGDGVFWYALMLSLPCFWGEPGLKAALVMAVTGATGLVLYKSLKHRLVRERPYIRFVGIEAAMAPLDRYSFPSGHTLHAVAFTVVATYYFPMLAWILVPMAALVATSRVVLGLHYPSDVLAGALLGAALAVSAIYLF